MGYSMTVTENLFENLKLELRRGCLTLAVLAQLRQEHYGYTLRKDLAERGLEIDESTLYPLLRRLETQGLLASEWREEEKRNKRFYRLSADGEQILGKLLQEWQAINESINRIV
jgi:PadR family transcriptional regulator, regulatory protein PadR